MRDATVRYLQGSFKKISDTLDTGKQAPIFGTGEKDVFLTGTGAFCDMVADVKLSNILEYRNVTIAEGSDISGTSENDRPFFLKVNGTLMVNGHLHMDGKGGSWNTNTSDNGHVWQEHGLRYQPLYPDSVRYNTDNYWLSKNQYIGFKNYGEANPFFDFKVGLTGAGCVYKSMHYKHKHRYGYGKWCGSFINSGGIPHEGNSRDNEWGKYNYKGGGGGFLALYYEDLDNKYGTIFTTESGEKAPLNIHANASWYLGPTPYRGGGMMVIAARHIVIGPNGSITCDGGANADGGCALLNISPNSNLNNNRLTKQLIFNKGNPYYTTNFYYKSYFSGGSGICYGYQVIPSYRMQNH